MLRYQVPGTKKFTLLTEQKYLRYSTQMKVKLTNEKHISLTGDLRKDSLNFQSYLGLTAHFIENKVFESVTIGVCEKNERHTANNIVFLLKNMLNNWNVDLDQVIIFVTHNAANITKAAVELFGEDRHLGCFAHSLNLVVSNGLEKCVKVLKIVKKVKMVVSHFNKAQNSSDA